MNSKYLGEGEMATTDNATRAHHRRAMTYWWVVLIVSTVLSVAGNAGHAWLVTEGGALQKSVAALLAAIPPIVFFATVEGIAMLVRAGASGRVYRTAVAITAAVAVGAFVVSFATLRDFALHWGALPADWLAWLFPGLLDTVMALSTFVLVALGDKPVPRTKTHREPPQRAPRRGVKRALLETWNGEVSAAPATSARTEPQVSASSAPSAPPPVHQNPVPVHRAPAPLQRTTDATSAPRSDAPRISVPVHADEHLDRARSMVADGVVSIEPEKVAAVLATVAGGASATKAAEAVGVNRRTVAKIIAADVDQNQPDQPSRVLAAV